MMLLWVSQAMGDGILLTGEVLRQKWNSFADLAGILEDDRLTLSNGWLAHFKERNNLMQQKQHGEAASASAGTVELERKRVQELIRDSGYELQDIFNMDETGLFYGYTPVTSFPTERLTLKNRMAPDRGLSDHAQSGVKGNKSRLTYALTSNAEGLEKLPPFIIGKAAQPRAFNKKSGGQLGFYYWNNAKVWMTTQLYQDWIQQWDQELQKTNQKILLLQDNFSGHIVPPDLQCIRVENFQPNLTAHIQPNDQGIIPCIIQCFKVHYCAQFIQRAVDRYDEGITPSQIYEINQLQAMRIADAVWRNVDTMTIRNCWHRAGILPEITPSSLHVPKPIISISALLHNSSSQMDPIKNAEKQVEAMLDDLVATGALQHGNCMDIESLLNPYAESHTLTDILDKEIYQAIMDAKEAHENLEINGGDDVDENFPPEP
jgi:hypothetical protein